MRRGTNQERDVIPIVIVFCARIAPIGNLGFLARQGGRRVGMYAIRPIVHAHAGAHVC